MFAKKRSKRRPLFTTATSLAIRPRLGWQGYILRSVCILALLGSCSWIAYLAGRLTHSGFQGITVQDVFRVRHEARRLMQDNRLLIHQADRIQQLQAFESAAHKKLLKRLLQLEQENQSLRHQLGLLEKIMGRPDNVEPISVASLNAQRDMQGVWHYQALLTIGNPHVHFHGRYRLIRSSATDASPPIVGDIRPIPTFRNALRLEGQVPVEWASPTELTLEILPISSSRVVASRRISLPS